MRIVVHTFTGKTLLFDDVAPNTKVSDLQTRVQEGMRLKKPLTSLSWDGVDLQLERPISFYSSESALVLNAGEPECHH